MMFVGVDSQQQFLDTYATNLIILFFKIKLRAIPLCKLIKVNTSSEVFTVCIVMDYGTM
jgi:hypothetical protein